MKVIEVRNVHEALLRGMDLLHVDGFIQKVEMVRFM